MLARVFLGPCDIFPERADSNERTPCSISVIIFFALSLATVPPTHPAPMVWRAGEAGALSGSRSCLVKPPLPVGSSCCHLNLRPLPHRTRIGLRYRVGTQAARFTRKRSLSGSMSVQIPSGTLSRRRKRTGRPEVSKCRVASVLVLSPSHRRTNP